MNEPVTYFTTASGLRIVHRQCESRVEYCGVTVNAGSRDERRGLHGIAHFIEHTIFKGTRFHKASFILNRMEEIGGELNAYTTKEETVVYTISPAGGFRRGATLLGEIVCHSIFPAAEIEREREVVADEIDSYDDTPSEAVFDYFDEYFFKNSSLAHNILGTSQSIKGFTPDICRKFLEEYYTAPNMVFFYMGPESAENVFNIVSTSFSDLPQQHAPLKRISPKKNRRFDTIKEISSHQAHTVIGAKIPGLNSLERYPMALLSNILGGPGMNSLLNVALREKRGLVYTVDAQANLYTDCGAFTIYFGCDHDDVAKCRRLIANLLDRLAQSPLTPHKLEAAKRQYLGQCVVSSENREQEALSMGRAVLRFNEVRSFEEIKEQIMGITADDILKTSQLLSQENMSALTLQ